MINKLKENKGITLIALIITIIVLLILSGVVINMTLGNEGIIAKAQSSVDAYKNAQEKEEWELAKAENRIDNYVDGSRGNYTITSNDIGKIVIYSGNTDKIVLFKIVAVNGEKATIACIPNSDTPRLNIIGNAGASEYGNETDDENFNSFIGKTKKMLLDKCIESFKNESLGIKESDIRIATRADYNNGLIPKKSIQTYWLAECSIYVNGADANWSKDIVVSSGIGSALMYNIMGRYTGDYTYAVCPIITIDKNLLKTNESFVLK